MCSSSIRIIVSIDDYFSPLVAESPKEGFGPLLLLLALSGFSLLGRSLAAGAAAVAAVLLAGLSRVRGGRSLVGPMFAEIVAATMSSVESSSGGRPRDPLPPLPLPPKGLPPALLDRSGLSARSGLSLRSLVLLLVLWVLSNLLPRFTRSGLISPSTMPLAVAVAE